MADEEALYRSEALEQIRRVDPEVAEAIAAEVRRQQQTLELIASENFASRAVMAAQGLVMTNKYAEGYPGRRYYGGCRYVDIPERLAIERAQALFGAEHVNVQPHSGAQANQAVYFAALEPGATIMGMALPHGGHLTHGSPVNLSGKWFRVIPYHVSRETEELDYDEVRRLALEHRPKLIVAGASAYPRQLAFARLAAISQEPGALLMVDMAHIAGLVAAGLHPNPVPHATFVTTTTHKTLRGPRGGLILTTAEWGPAVDKAVFPGIQGGPLMHVIAAKAVALKEALTPEFRAYQEQVVRNARALGQALQERGWRLVTGGTDTHLLLVDVKARGLTGKEAEERLEAVGITVNKNTIPFDTEKPFIASGIRLGTPAVTTRGMKEGEMVLIADLIDRALTAPAEAAAIADQVRQLTDAFPLYPGWP